MKRLWLGDIANSTHSVPDRSSQQCRLLHQSSRCLRIVAMVLELHRRGLLCRKRREQSIDAC